MSKKKDNICHCCKKRLISGNNWTAYNERVRKLICKACNVVKQREYREANREKYLAAARKGNLKWRAANPDKFHASVARWKKANPDKVAKYRKEHEQRKQAQIEKEQENGTDE